jgi:hypothetical protein
VLGDLLVLIRQVGVKPRPGWLRNVGHRSLTVDNTCGRWSPVSAWAGGACG